MRWIRGTLLSAGLCVLGGQARAQVSPCYLFSNPPGARIRYDCTSTSRHTIDHSDAVRLATHAWRTRITARREGSADVFNVTVDSLSAPPADPAVQAVLAEASLSVAGTGYGVAPPALLSSSTTAVILEPVSHVVMHSSVVTETSVASSATSRIFCVGDLGDLAQPPPPLPEPPGCSASAWKVELRPFDVSSMSPPPSDRLDDTNTHMQTDRYSTLLVTGELTTWHYEVVAHALSTQPCLATPTSVGVHYECTSSSRYTVKHDSASSLNGSVWSTRITGRVPGGPPLFDVTLNADIAPDLDDGVRRAFQDARRAVADAVGPSSSVSGPILLSSSIRAVNDAYLPAVTRVVPLTSSLKAASLYLTATTICVGDLGELASGPPNGLPTAPCVITATPVELRGYNVIRPFGIVLLPYDDIVSTHIHSERDDYPGLFVTGTFMTSQYEFVAEGSSTALTVPIVLSSSGGSAFTSELTLTNRGSTDARVSYAYTPAFGGTAGTGTDTLPAERQRVIPDAIAYLEGLGVTNPGSGGTLRITFEGVSSLDAASATVRTTAAVPDGRVGLAYAGLPPWKLLSAPVYLGGLRQNAVDRSNVAVMNAGALGDGDVTLRLTVFSGDPANPQTKPLPDITLSPGGFSQVSGILVSNGLSLGNGYVKVERISGAASFYAYGVVNDQGTSDGSFIEPVMANPPSLITATTLPVVVETAAYATELILTNTSSSSRSLRFTWVSASLTGGQARFSIPLLPGEQQILPAFVQVLRDRGIVTNLPGGTLPGALFASDDSGDLRGISIAARITSPVTGGRAGVFLPAFPSGSEATTSAWLCGLQQNAETRSNLALVNTGSIDSSPSTFRIDLFDGATGVKAASPVSTVPAKGFVQIDRVLSIYAPDSSNGCALVTKLSGSNPFIAYAVLNDGGQPGQRSGDGAFVAASIPAP